MHVRLNKYPPLPDNTISYTSFLINKLKVNMILYNLLRKAIRALLTPTLAKIMIKKGLIHTSKHDKYDNANMYLEKTQNL